MPKTKPIRRSPDKIRKILADLEASGLSRARFAAQSGIPISTIHSWVKKAKAQRRSDSPNVIPIGTLPTPATPAIEIELPSGEVLRLGPGCQRQDLRLVLSELRRC